MAFNFDINDPKNQRILATILVPVVAGYAFFNFMIKPQQQKVKSTQAQVTTMKKRVDAIKKTLEKPDSLRTEKSELEIRFKELEILLPSEENVSQLLDQFASVEQDAKVYMVGFEAAETVDTSGKPYRANRYRLTVESGFHQFSTFVSSIMSLSRILSISDITIQPNTTVLAAGEEFTGPEDQPRSLTVECILTSYVFTGFTDQPQEEKK